MNHWPPPSVDDAPPAPPGAVTSTRWWQHPIAMAVLVAWLVGGMIALVAIGLVRAVEPEAALRPTSTSVSTSSPGSPGSSAPDSTATAGSTTTAGPSETATGATSPRVQSAPPVPPASGASTTTLVVTLPPTTTVAPVTMPALPPVIEVEINFDAEGDDATNPNGEWVRFVNGGARAVDMTGWVVRDDGFEHTHVFAPLTLEAGAGVTLFSGCGIPTANERFFCAGEVWDDDGDVVSLIDDAGVLVVQRHG